MAGELLMNYVERILHAVGYRRVEFVRLLVEAELADPSQALVDLLELV